MTFFRSFFRLLAAFLATAVVGFAPKLIALFQGAAPSDVPLLLWGVVGMVGVFLVNFLVGKIKLPTSEG